MFCPHCGIESTGDLNYCKRCGGNLNLVTLAPAPQARPPISTGTAFVVGGSTLLLVIVGLGLLLVALGELRHSSMTPDVFKLIIAFGMMTLLGSVVCLTWLWAYLLGGSRSAGNAAQLKAPTHTNELGPARHAAALPRTPRRRQRRRTHHAHT